MSSKSKIAPKVRVSAFEKAKAELLTEVKSAISGHEAAFANAATALYENQRNLMISHQALDEQFAVMLKLLFTKVNEVSAKIDEMKLSRQDDTQIKVTPVTYDYVNSLFEEFSTLKSFEGYQEYFRAWYEGESSKSIEKRAKKRILPVEVSPALYPAGAEFFGGDYSDNHKNDERSKSQELGNESEGLEGSVSELPSGHSSESEPTNGEESKLLH